MKLIHKLCELILTMIEKCNLTRYNFQIFRKKLVDPKLEKIANRNVFGPFDIHQHYIHF